MGSRVILADTDVWLALVLSRHVFHSDARDWFDHQSAIASQRQEREDHPAIYFSPLRVERVGTHATGETPLPLPQCPATMPCHGARATTSLREDWFDDLAVHVG